MQIGVDLGSRTTSAGAVDSKGHVISFVQARTDPEASATNTAYMILDLIYSAAKNAGVSIEFIDSIGVGCPGWVENGIVRRCSTLPNFFDVPLRDILEERLATACYIENDGNCVTLGEYHRGALQGSVNGVVIMLGSAIAGGHIHKGKVIQGARGSACEFGHMVIVPEGRECTCGRKGCLEQYISMRSLLRNAREAGQNDLNSMMWQLCKGDLADLDVPLFMKAVKAGDRTAAAVFDTFMYYLKITVVNIANVFNPDIIAIGGSISREGDFITKPLLHALKREGYLKEHEFAHILPIKNGETAGIIGASFLGLQVE